MGTRDEWWEVHMAIYRAEHFEEVNSAIVACQKECTVGIRSHGHQNKMV